jgi:ribosomal protein S18 acetylase RimI-like enzyme
MFTIKNSKKQALPKLADCHITCFPSSLASRLGSRYVQKTLEWFLVNPNRFLYHIEVDEKVAGYCGGFVPIKFGDGSSSGMLQYAFNEAIKGIIKNPLLLFHAEVRQHYPFIWMNIKRKLTGKTKPAQPVPVGKPFNPFVGLVVIAVHPHYRGTGIAQQLMNEFENRVRQYNQNEVVLSVKKDNGRAIKAYQKFGLKIKEEHAQTYVMNKFI